MRRGAQLRAKQRAPQGGARGGSEAKVLIERPDSAHPRPATAGSRAVIADTAPGTLFL